MFLRCRNTFKALFKFPVQDAVVLGLQFVPSKVNVPPAPPPVPGITLALRPPARTSKLATCWGNLKKKTSEKVQDCKEFK